MKQIAFELSVESVNQAIQEVKKYQAELKYKCQRLAEKLAEEGVFIARVKIAEYRAIDDGALLGSIHSEYVTSSETGGTYRIVTNCSYAPYVEFGFGIVGSKNPHPESSLIAWKYDINSHGEKGWYYMKNGEWHWSKGQPSKPFMYMTAKELKTKVETIAKEVFSDA